jgi:hypothetical protein
LTKDMGISSQPSEGQACGRKIRTQTFPKDFTVRANYS